MILNRYKQRKAKKKQIEAENLAKLELARQQSLKASIKNITDSYLATAAAYHKDVDEDLIKAAERFIRHLDGLKEEEKYLE